jgi:hypothetical protein
MAEEHYWRIKGVLRSHRLLILLPRLQVCILIIFWDVPMHFKTLFKLIDWVNTVVYLTGHLFYAIGYKVFIKLFHMTTNIGQQYKIFIQDFSLCEIVAYRLRDQDWMTPIHSIFNYNRKWFCYILLFNSDCLILPDRYILDHRFRNRQYQNSQLIRYRKNASWLMDRTMHFTNYTIVVLWLIFLDPDPTF